MPPRNGSTARSVVEIRNAAGHSLLLTSVDWTDSQRDLAISGVLKLVGFKPAAPAKRKGNKASSSSDGAASKGAAEDLSPFAYRCQPASRRFLSKTHHSCGTPNPSYRLRLAKARRKDGKARTD